MKRHLKPVILNTRPRAQALELTKALRQAGCRVVEIPLIEITPFSGAGFSSLNPSKYQGIFLSSSNGMVNFLNPLQESAKKEWLAKPLYTLSAKTSKQWESMGGRTAYCSRQKSLKGFLSEFSLSGQSVGQLWIHPCSVFTRLNPEHFRQAGIEVHNFPVYAPILPGGAEASLKQKLPEISAVIFMSGSAVDNFFKCLYSGDVQQEGFSGKVYFSSGPSSSEALERHGIKAYHQAKDAGTDGIVQAVKSVF